MELPSQVLLNEDDYDWNWPKMAKKLSRRVEYECVALQTEHDGKIQGAAIYHTEGNSYLDPSKRAIYVHRLAAAPRNRRKMLDPHGLKPIYGGTGTALLQVAIALSQELGLEGRVNAHPIPNAIEFYEKKKFQKTDSRNEEGDVLYEIDVRQAQSTLRETRLLYWGRRDEYVTGSP